MEQTKHTPEIKHHKEKLAIVCVKDHREIGYWTGNHEIFPFKILKQTVICFTQEEINEKFETWKEWWIKRGDPGIEMYVVPVRTNFETAAELDQLKEENERLKEDVAHAGKVHSKLNGDLMKSNDLNRELLEALKEMYMFEYGGNSVTIEDAIGRAPKSLIRKNDFEQKIISLIQKAS